MLCNYSLDSGRLFYGVSQSEHVRSGFLSQESIGCRIKELDTASADVDVRAASSDEVLNKDLTSLMLGGCFYAHSDFITLVLGSQE